MQRPLSSVFSRKGFCRGDAIHCGVLSLKCLVVRHKFADVFARIMFQLCRRVSKSISSDQLIHQHHRVMLAWLVFWKSLGQILLETANININCRRKVLMFLAVRLSSCNLNLYTVLLLFMLFTPIFNAKLALSLSYKVLII